MKLNNKKKLDNLSRVSLSIKVLYDKLYRLDKNNLKYTIEYEKTLEYLKIALDCEINCYRELQEDDLSDIINYVEFLLFLIDGKDNDIILDNISSFNNEKLKYIRILTKLYNMKNVSISDSELNNERTILKFNDNLINYYFLRLMNTSIKNNVLDDSILIAKYNLSFLVEKLEKENLTSQFSDSDLVIFDTEEDLNNSDKYISFHNRIFFGTDKEKILIVCDIMNIINKLLSFSDEQLTDNSKMIIFNIYTIYLRACFNFLDDEELISNLNERFEDDIHYNNQCEHSKAILLIRKAFSKIRRDKLYIESNVYKLKI